MILSLVITHIIEAQHRELEEFNFPVVKYKNKDSDSELPILAIYDEDLDFSSIRERFTFQKQEDKEKNKENKWIAMMFRRDLITSDPPAPITRSFETVRKDINRLEANVYSAKAGSFQLSLKYFCSSIELAEDLEEYLFVNKYQKNRKMQITLNEISNMQYIYNIHEYSISSKEKDRNSSICSLNCDLSIEAPIFLLEKEKEKLIGKINWGIYKNINEVVPMISGIIPDQGA